MVHTQEMAYIYRQESGNTFDGEVIFGRYRSPDLTFNDPGIRKHMQRVILNYKPEAAIDADLLLRYDYEDPDSARPAAYALDSSELLLFTVHLHMVYLFMQVLHNL